MPSRHSDSFFVLLIERRSTLPLRQPYPFIHDNRESAMKMDVDDRQKHLATYGRIENSQKRRRTFLARFFSGSHACIMQKVLRDTGSSRDIFNVLGAGIQHLHCVCPYLRWQCLHHVYDGMVNSILWHGAAPTY